MGTAILVDVEYVGNKPQAIDNIARSGAVWNGKGDVQPVTEEVAEALEAFPDQWKRVVKMEEANKKPADTKADKPADTKAEPKGSKTDTAVMNATQLREYAKREHGAKFKIGMTTDAIRAEVERLDLLALEQEQK